MSDDVSKPKSSSTMALEQLRTLIFTGQLGAGTDHLENELAERLGMSRTPVREALLVLEGQGLVEVRPRKGVRIRTLSPADMEEVYDVLTALESLAAANAARAEYGEDTLTLLTHSIDQMDDALAHEDRDAWAVADDSFHAELVRLGGNSRVQAIVEMMSDQVRRARLVTLHMRPLPLDSNKDHRALLGLIRKGDAEGAEALHHRHRSRAKMLLIALLKKHHLNRL